MTSIEDSKLLDDVLRKLNHLNVKDYIGTLEPVKAQGASCDVYTGYLRVGIRQTKVAVKKLRFYWEDEAPVAKKLAKEANILPLLGFFLGDGKWRSPHLVSMWMAKGTLFEYLKVLEHGTETIRMAEGIAAGVLYLHSEHIVHSDLKSPNILISDTGRPLITDFGVSRIMAASVTMMCGTTAQALKGTLRWMAIELLLPTEDSDSVLSTEQSDVWAFGMVLYELLSRKLPYENLKYDAHVINAVISGTLPSAPPFDDASPEKILWDVCELCWEFEPDVRPNMDFVHMLIRMALPIDSKTMYLTLEEQDSTHLFRSQAAIVPARGQWFATYDPFVDPERQLNIDLIHTFNESSKTAWYSFSLDCKRLCRDLRDGSEVALIYDTETWKLVDFIPIARMTSTNISLSHREIRLSPNGAFLAVYWIESDRIEVQVWDVTTGAVCRCFVDKWVTFCGSQPEQVATFDSKSLTIEIQDIFTARVVSSLSLSSHNSSTGTIETKIYDISLDGKLFAAETLQGKVYIWSLTSGDRNELVGHLQGDGTRSQELHGNLLFTSDGKFLVKQFRSPKVCQFDFWDVSEFDEMPPAHVRTLTLSPDMHWEVLPFIGFDGQLLIEAVENRIYFRDARTSQIRLMLQDHNETVTSIRLSPRGDLVVSSSRDGSAKVWKLSSVF